MDDSELVQIQGKQLRLFLPPFTMWLNSLDKEFAFRSKFFLFRVKPFLEEFQCPQKQRGSFRSSLPLKSVGDWGSIVRINIVCIKLTLCSL